MAFHGLVKDSITLAVVRKASRGPRKPRRRAAHQWGQRPEVTEVLRETAGMTLREALDYAAAKGRAQSASLRGKR
jgi:hypothetical protein